MAIRKKRRRKTIRKASRRRKPARNQSVGQLLEGSARKVGRAARKLANKAISKVRSLKFV